MLKPRTIPVALTIAGSDSGGGAGLQADLKTFTALGVHGTVAVTCVTAQNPAGVRAIESCRPAMVRRQIEAVFEGLTPAAVKTGMLYSAEIIHMVAGFFRKRRALLVVDPVMIATSGARLLEPEGVKMMMQELLPLATLVTPNLDEASVLVGRQLRSAEDLRMAARELHRCFGCAALVKGGHLGGMRQAADFFYDGRTELMLSAPFVRGVKTHGTGCTYSAAVTAYLARGVKLPEAVAKAKEHITQAIIHSQKAGGNLILNNFWHENGGKRGEVR
ncbi:MAG TPA: bifunctional hydroxymethylpyrimidine kinase/phosphomethylpyrimidine kinase [Verrucomicrobiae bacterium]|nr:bifunctional hydroxymethylpyrimidine kinase/phosphomethylpyrimidine kinase [Verrucomicrobiae bacterium]